MLSSVYGVVQLWRRPSRTTSNELSLMLSSYLSCRPVWRTMSWTAKWVIVLDVVIYLWHCPALGETILNRGKWVLSWNSCISGFEGHLSEQPSEHCVGQLTTSSLFPPGWHPLLFSGDFKVFAFVGDTVVFCMCCLFVVSLFSAAIVIVVFCRSSPLSRSDAVEILLQCFCLPLLCIAGLKTVRVVWLYNAGNWRETVGWEWWELADADCKHSTNKARTAEETYRKKQQPTNQQQANRSWKGHRFYNL